MGSSLPPFLERIKHLNIIKREDIPLNDKIRLYKKYCVESKDWEIPRDNISREFALDLAIDALVNHKNWAYKGE